jgi:hypothetical protein
MRFLNLDALMPIESRVLTACRVTESIVVVRTVPLSLAGVTPLPSRGHQIMNLRETAENVPEGARERHNRNGLIIHLIAEPRL